MPPKKHKNRPKKRSKRSKEPVVENAMADCFLPNDIMLSILSRLPVKSLVRFKCVCKPWYNLVSKPSFVKLHYQQFPQTPKTFSFQSHALKCPILGIDSPNTFHPNGGLADILLDSCNGLVCMGRPFITSAIVLWNPATSFWKLLPPSSISKISGVVTMISLGFGCNAEGDDFKVVRIFCFKGKKMRARVKIEVYSSKSDSWTTMGVKFKFTVMEPKNHAIVNGNPYWIVCLNGRNRFAEGHDSDNVLLKFDSTSNEFKIVPSPKIGNPEEDGKMTFLNWLGSVAVIVHDMKNADLLEWIDVWVYDDGENKWRQGARFGPMEVRGVDMFLDGSRAGKIVGGCSSGKLFIYDPEKNCVGMSEFRRRNGSSLQIFGYDESLVHVKGMTPVVVKKEDLKDKFNDIDGFFVSSLNPRSREITCYYALAF